MTSDKWTGNHNKIHNLTLTLNYLINWTSRTRTLFTSKFPFAKISGRNILFDVQEQLQVFQINSDDFKIIVIVTVQRSDMIKAFEKNNRWDCSCHLLSTILKNTFEDKLLKKNLQMFYLLWLSITIFTIKECESLVTFLKQSGLAGNLEKMVLQSNDTRFNTMDVWLSWFLNRYYGDIPLIAV